MWWADVAFVILFILLLIALYALWKSCKSEHESSTTTSSRLLESQVDRSASLITQPPHIPQQMAPQQIPPTQPEENNVPVEEETTQSV